MESFVSIQRQINSLASVALQNRRALDLLTAEKGGTCLFLGEDCCYFVNETGIVQGRVKELRIKHCKRVTKSFHSPKPIPNWPSLGFPFLGPLVLIILLLLFGPSFCSLFQRFLQDRIWALSRVQVKTILLKSLASRRKRRPWDLGQSSVPDPEPSPLPSRK